MERKPTQEEPLKPSNFNQALSMRVTPALRNKLDALAKRKCQPVSTIIREAIVKFVEEEAK